MTSYLCPDNRPTTIHGICTSVLRFRSCHMTGYHSEDIHRLRTCDPSVPSLRQRFVMLRCPQDITWHHRSCRGGRPSQHDPPLPSLPLPLDPRKPCWGACPGELNYTGDAWRPASCEENVEALAAEECAHTTEHSAVMQIIPGINDITPTTTYVIACHPSRQGAMRTGHASVLQIHNITPDTTT